MRKPPWLTERQLAMVRKEVKLLADAWKLDRVFVTVQWYQNLFWRVAMSVWDDENEAISSANWVDVISGVDPELIKAAWIGACEAGHVLSVGRTVDGKSVKIQRYNGTANKQLFAATSDELNALLEPYAAGAVKHTPPPALNKPKAKAR